MIQKTFFSLLIACSLSSLNAQKQVVLDNFYNNEFDSKSGKSFHYLWEDASMGGFSEFGKLFSNQGATLSLCKEKPTAQNLNGADVFIIVDPDNKLETAHPNFMDATAAHAIASWVKKGGVLLLLTNDAAHAELDSFNLLAAKFGMQFGKETLHPERSEQGKPRNFNSCSSVAFPKHPLFKDVSKIFLKEIAPIVCTAPATPVLVEKDQVIIAEANFGKGYVFAIGDPWLYNEYIGHFLLPADFQNSQAAANLVELLLNRCR